MRQLKGENETTLVRINSDVGLNATVFMRTIFNAFWLEHPIGCCNNCVTKETQMYIKVKGILPATIYVCQAIKSLFSHLNRMAMAVLFVSTFAYMQTQCACHRR